MKLFGKILVTSHHIWQMLSTNCTYSKGIFQRSEYVHSYIMYCIQLHTTHFRQGTLVFKSTRTLYFHSTLTVHQKPQHPAYTKLTDCKHLPCKNPKHQIAWFIFNSRKVIQN